MEDATTVSPEVFEDLFPAKLHYVLEQVERDGQSDVITWQSHGKAFLVKDRERFVRELLPNWFRQNKWASFQRQLNHYDFKRITTGPDRNAYYHPCFVRIDRTLCRYMRRSRCKGKGPRKPSKPEDQPNFYEDSSSSGSAAEPAASARRSATPPRAHRHPALMDSRPSFVVSRTSSADPAVASFPVPLPAPSMPYPPDPPPSQAAGFGPGISHPAHHHHHHPFHPPPPSLRSMLGGPHTWPPSGTFHPVAGPAAAAAAGYYYQPPGPPQHYSHPHPHPQPFPAGAEASAAAGHPGGWHSAPHPVHYDAASSWEYYGGDGDGDGHHAAEPPRDGRDRRVRWSGGVMGRGPDPRRPDRSDDRSM